MSDLDNFLNDFENELDNRNTIDSKKEDLFNDIIKNILTDINKGSRHRNLFIIKGNKFNDISDTIKDYLCSHTLSEAKDLLDIDKCFKLIGSKKNIIDKLDITECHTNISLYNIKTIDTFLSDMLRTKKEQLFSTKNIFGNSTQIKPYNIQGSVCADENGNLHIITDGQRYNNKNWLMADGSTMPLPYHTHSDTPSVPSVLKPWVSSIPIVTQSSLSDENYGKLWCRIGDGTKLDKQLNEQYSNDNPWNPTKLWKELTGVFRKEDQNDETYKEYIREFYDDLNEDCM